MIKEDAKTSHAPLDHGHFEKCTITLSVAWIYSYHNLK